MPTTTTKKEDYSAEDHIDKPYPVHLSFEVLAVQDSAIVKSGYLERFRQVRNH